MGTLTELVVKVGADLSELKRGMDKGVGKLRDNLGKIAVGGAAMGAGLEAAARKVAPLNEATQKLAQSTGISDAAMRDFAIAAAGAGDPLEEVLATMEAGRQQGIKTGKGLEQFASTWDTIADATGESTIDLAKASVALRGVGIAAGDEGKAMAAFGFISQETTGSVAEFLKFLKMSGPEIREMGLDVNDSAAMLGILEKEFGLTGRKAKSEFASAVKSADGDVNKMLKTLGISETQLEAYKNKVAESSGVIERNAQAHEDSITPMEKMSHWASELMYKHGDLIQMVSALAVPLIALGPITAALTGAYGLLTGKMATAAATWVVSHAKMVASAISAKVAIVGAWASTAASTAGSWLAMQARAAAGMAATVASATAMKARIVAVWVSMHARMMAVTAANWARMAALWVAKGAVMAATMVKTSAKVIANWVRMAAVATVQAARMAAAWLLAMGPIPKIIAIVVGLVAVIVKNWGKIWSTTKRVWNAISEFIGGILDGIGGFLKGAVNVIIDGINWLIGGVNDFIRWYNRQDYLPGTLGEIGKIPRLAEGAIVNQSILANVGEAGPEAVIPLDRLDAMLSHAANNNGSPQRVVLDVTGADEDFKRLIRKMVRVDGRGNVQMAFGR